MKFGDVERITFNTLPVDVFYKDGVVVKNDNYEIFLDYKDANGAKHTKKMKLRDFSRLLGVAGEYFINATDSYLAYSDTIMDSSKLCLYRIGNRPYAFNYVSDYKYLNTAKPMVGLDQNDNHKFSLVFYDEYNHHIIYYADDQTIVSIY